MTAPNYPGKVAMEALGWLAGPEHLQRDLLGWFMGFEASGRHSAFEAFQALELVVAERLQRPDAKAGDYGGIGPTTPTEVPWWIAFVVAKAWGDYIEGRRTLGQAFGLEGIGRGTHRTVAMKETERKRRLLAIEVASRMIAKDQTYERATGEVASQYGQSRDLVELAYKAHGRRATELLAPLAEKKL